MLNNRKLRANASVSLGALLVGVSLFSINASAQFRRNGNFAGNEPVLYADPNFTGVRVVLRGDTPDLRPYNLNDKVSSIELPAGQTWEVCQDVNFGSTCQILRGSVADLRTTGWNDRISSLRRVDGNFQNGRNQNGDIRDRRSGRVFSQPQSSQDLVFYDRTGYRGAAYDQRSIGNRTARSVEVRSGTWQLCDRTGRCTTIDQSVSDLSRLGLNGQITSVRPVDNARARPRVTPRDRIYGR
jgi:beta/gamma crystallin